MEVKDVWFGSEVPNSHVSGTGKKQGPEGVHPVVFLLGFGLVLSQDSRMNKAPVKKVMPFPSRTRILPQIASFILVTSENEWIPRVC